MEQLSSIKNASGLVTRWRWGNNDQPGLALAQTGLEVETELSGNTGFFFNLVWIRHGGDIDVQTEW